MLLAGTLMVACEKEPQTPQTPPTPPTPPEDTTMSITITFNSQDYTTFNHLTCKTVFKDGYECALFEGHPKDASDIANITSEWDVCPGFRVMLKGSEVGNYKSEGYDPEEYLLNGSVIYFEFFSSGALYGDGAFFGDWWGMNATVDLTKFDLTSGLASLKGSGDMFCSGEAIMMGQGIDAASKGFMSVDIKNIPIAR